jgi:hypothetical protein
VVDEFHPERTADFFVVVNIVYSCFFLLFRTSRSNAAAKRRLNSTVAGNNFMYNSS